VLAVWCYSDPKLDDPLLDAMLHRCNRGTIEEYWPPERDLVLEAYRSIRFPFPELPPASAGQMPPSQGYP
jgi:hypothetical protein